MAAAAAAYTASSSYCCSLHSLRSIHPLPSLHLHALPARRPKPRGLAAKRSTAGGTPADAHRDGPKPRRRPKSSPVGSGAQDEEAAAAAAAEEKPRRGRGRPKSRTASAVQMQLEEDDEEEKEGEEWPDGNGVAIEEAAELGAIGTEDEEEESVDAATAAAAGGELGGYRKPRPREVFVCNLPRRYEIDHLLELFKPYGTVLSVEVSRDLETGVSRGCGFVTMRSLAGAISAISALDGYELDGREILVKLSSDLRRRSSGGQFYTSRKKDVVLETRHKIYVGNVAWSVRPQDLREHFGRCGTVVSTRLLTDRKGQSRRAYAFLSFSSADEVEAALKLNSTRFHGRQIIVWEAHAQQQQT